MSLWQWILAFLAWLSADPQAIDLERPRAAGAVAVAYAAFAPDAEPPAPPAPPAPAECACGGTCVNGYWKPDGRISQVCPCPKTCKCKSKACPDGKCPTR